MAITELGLRAPGSAGRTLEAPVADAAPPRHRLGEILLANGSITEPQLEHALAQQESLKLPLGKILLRLNYVTDETVRQALSKQLGIPFIDLEKVTIDRRLARVINRSYARRHSVLPIAQVGRTLTVAMDDPTAAGVIDELMQLTSFGITVVTSSSRAIQRAFRRLYEDETQSSIENLGAHQVAPVDPPVETGPQLSVPGSVDDRATRRADDLFRQILFRALESHCSDIHLEMLPSGLHVRYRIDGVLRQPAFRQAPATHLDQNMREITSRIRILCKLDIAERRRPQDGSFQASVNRAGSKVTDRSPRVRHSQLLGRERGHPHPGPDAGAPLHRRARPVARGGDPPRGSPPAPHRHLPRDGADRIGQVDHALRLSDEAAPSGDPHPHRRGSRSSTSTTS